MNRPEHISEDLLEQARILMNEKAQIEKIKTVLNEAGHNEASIKSALDLLKKEKHNRDLNNGLRLLTTGGLILIISFAITVYFFHTNVPLDYFMYISSIIGISLCFLGFKKIFE
jgi:hypothetical protein